MSRESESPGHQLTIPDGGGVHGPGTATEPIDSIRQDGIPHRRMVFALNPSPFGQSVTWQHLVPGDRPVNLTEISRRSSDASCPATHRAEALFGLMRSGLLGPLPSPRARL